MRAYDAVMNLILELDNIDDDIRVVMMNGSKVNSNVDRILCKTMIYLSFRSVDYTMLPLKTKF